MITNVPGGVTLEVAVVPRAGRTALAGIRNGMVLVRLAAAPVDGAANEALVALLADVIGVPKRRVAITNGEHTRRKRVRIDGVSASDVAARLTQAGVHVSAHG